MPNNVKTYNGSDDPEDHLKIFQAVAKVERWAMPTWCHMFNSTLTGFARVWFDDLPPESINSYNDLKKVFLANFLQQKKCIKDPEEIHHIKQKEGESTEDFVQRFKAKSMHVKGAPECMRISEFMYGITNPELIKCLYDNIPKSVEEMMRRSERRRDKFTLLTKSPKEILALNKGKFMASPPMTTSVEKRNNNKLCEIHREVGHNTDESMHLRRQIKKLIKSRKLSHVIKELKQGDEEGAECPMIIETEIGGHFIHRIYVDGGSASEILYEHCFNMLHPKVKNRMVPATAPLIGFRGEIIWLIGQILLPDHRKARSKEDSSSPINNSQNAKIPGPRKDTHSLKHNLDIFAWKPEDMMGVLRHLAEHRLNVREGCSPVRQKKRSQALERNKAIQEESEYQGDKDFIVEHPEDDPLDTPIEVEEELPDPWTLFTDGSSCKDSSRAGLILINPEGAEFTYALRFRFDANNNEAEYEALIAGLRIAEQMGIKNLQANVDSRLVANQVPRSENKKADALSIKASTSFAHLTKQVLVEELKEKSINEAEVLAVVEEEEILLYKKSYIRPWLRCVGPLQANYVLREIHEGSCIMHAGKRSLVAKAIRTGYYWLTMHADVGKMIRECQDCQRFASAKHPQANGLVERANKSLGEGIKARLDERSNDWNEEIPHVLWAHHAMIKSSNEDTPFSLTYGTKAVIPEEIGMPTLRTMEVDMVQNDEALEINLDLLEGRSEQAAIREARSKAKIEKYYNSKVCNTSFKPGDLLYRNNDASHAKDSGKLSPK
ncbi:reverse transcriptase domain-containing protein [Tanacetum coccineum]